MPRLATYKVLEQKCSGASMNAVSYILMKFMQFRQLLLAWPGSSSSSGGSRIVP
jgi:hypothetical protein